MKRHIKLFEEMEMSFFNLTKEDLAEIEEHYSCGCPICDKVYNRTIPNLKSDNGYLCPVVSNRITNHIIELLNKPLTYENFK